MTTLIQMTSEFHNSLGTKLLREGLLIKCNNLNLDFSNQIRDTTSNYTTAALSTLLNLLINSFLLVLDNFIHNI
jgi:hypothetical protein